MLSLYLIQMHMIQKKKKCTIHTLCPSVKSSNNSDQFEREC